MLKWLARAARLGNARSEVLAGALLPTIEAYCFNRHLGGASFVAAEPKSSVDKLLLEFAPELDEPRKARTRQHVGRTD